MALCENCQDFDIQAFDTGDGFKYRGFPLSEVLDSVDKGCSVCTLMLETLLFAEDGDSKFSYLGNALRKRRGEKLPASFWGRARLA